jgi:hypothetical protein
MIKNRLQRRQGPLSFSFCNADDFSASTLPLVLFVAVTFLGIIILLNMLIALVVTS